MLAGQEKQIAKMSPKATSHFLCAITIPPSGTARVKEFDKRFRGFVPGDSKSRAYCCAACGYPFPAMQGAKDQKASPVDWEKHGEVELDKETNFSHPSASFDKDHLNPHNDTGSEKETRTPFHEKETGLVETSFTGDDKVIGQNIPVGHLQPEAYSTDDSNTTTSAEERIETDYRNDQNGPVYAEDKHQVVNEKEATVDTVEEEGQEKEDETKYPGGVALALLTLGLCMSTFVVALDNTIIGKSNN